MLSFIKNNTTPHQQQITNRPYQRVYMNVTAWMLPLCQHSHRHLTNVSYYYTPGVHVPGPRHKSNIPLYRTISSLPSFVTWSQQNIPLTSPGANKISYLPSPGANKISYLRRATVIRTHDVHKNPHIPLFLSTIFGPGNYVFPSSGVWGEFGWVGASCSLFPIWNQSRPTKKKNAVGKSGPIVCHF